MNWESGIFCKLYKTNKYKFNPPKNLNLNENAKSSIKSIIEKQIKDKIDEVRTDWNEKHGQVTEGMYKCRICGGKKTIQHEQQTRSADEPMTLFITCVNCKYTWKG